MSLGDLQSTVWLLVWFPPRSNLPKSEKSHQLSVIPGEREKQSKGKGLEPHCLDRLAQGYYFIFSCFLDESAHCQVGPLPSGPTPISLMDQSAHLNFGQSHHLLVILYISNLLHFSGPTCLLWQANVSNTWWADLSNTWWFNFVVGRLVLLSFSWPHVPCREPHSLLRQQCVCALPVHCHVYTLKQTFT